MVGGYDVVDLHAQGSGQEVTSTEQIGRQSAFTPGNVLEEADFAAVPQLDHQRPGLSVGVDRPTDAHQLTPLLGQCQKRAQVVHHRNRILRLHVNRIECVEAFARVRNGAVVIVSPGFTGHELAVAQHDDATLYNMEMGYAAPMCLGLALANSNQQVVALEGDGSMLMSIGTLATVGRYAPKNLTIVVFDNGRYLTTGSGSVATATAHGVDLAAIARGAGIVCALTVEDLAAFEAAISKPMAEDGPWLIIARVDGSDRDDSRARGSFPNDLVEQSVLFQLALRRRNA
jgi:hypothetical protein